ncbi:MarR family winged helix-turn-helix transcriptional regulator [Mycolicibacterium sp. HK-90]|uniref:MarR family winged helix-turn-helix transcriptional regulator n=1 Tax=Mycolicibacterium sp. HK-90 TaxID=3056937 RepID=UPI0026598773|nr:MarR family winged helix-turn-helix transcriptional regulator [Mycolicibacterium sp. HK-90]WKG06470.1 MarR family winged helix-turn-helix transcriptional regulator [Mycolicibacterium sp. HK-90]
MLTLETWGQGLDNATMKPSDDAVRSWECFQEVAGLLYREIDVALMAKHGLTIPDVHILHRLNNVPRQGVRIGALAELLVLAPSRVTWQVGRLEYRGLARRVRSRKDRRIVVVGITRKGQDQLGHALRTYAAIVRRDYLAPLTREQMTALGDCARRVSDALKVREELEDLFPDV